MLLNIVESGEGRQGKDFDSIEGCERNKHHTQSQYNNSSGTFGKLVPIGNHRLLLLRAKERKRKTTIFHHYVGL